MANDMVFHTQIASIMEVLANAAVAEICKLVDDDYAVLRLEMSQSQKENRGLRRKLQLLELKVARERAERTIRERVLASRPSSVKILDRYRGMARGEGHLTVGHRSIVKPAEHNAWRDDQPIAIDEVTGTSTQHVIVIEIADQTQTDWGNWAVILLLAQYLPVFRQSQRMVYSRDDGEALHSSGDDPSCSYATEMNPGNISLGLETQTALSRGYWNGYSSSVYSEGCLDKKGEVTVVDDVKVKGDAPLTWNVDETHLGHSQGRDFLDYRKILETNHIDATNSPLHSFGDRDPVSVSMAPSDSHGCVLFDQVLNSKDQRAWGGGPTSDHSQETGFFCIKGFSCPQKVEIHQRVHTGVKPFSCSQCEKRFSQSGDLKRHQRVHTGEKPFSCPQCEKRFSLAGNLKMHLKVHKGERPFACTHCGKRFSERSYLKIHQQKKHSTL
uniref:C2H2-type domain-containing protein n=1 Tax=Salmo trutta TaxID=8032 RepID=A0A673YE09_SALTR